MSRCWKLVIANMRMYSELEVLQTKMAKVRRWSFLRKLRRPRNKVMAQIEEVKGILTKAKWNFQVNISFQVL
jgi:hypothetical protein